MSVKDRIAAKKAAQGVAASETVTTGAVNAPATSLPPSPPVRSSRAQRFSSAGFVDSDQEPEKNNLVATKPTEPAPTPIKAPAPARAQAPAAVVSAPPAASRAQRFAEKAAHLKSSERGLVTKDRDANDVVLHRSLVVHEMSTCEWRSHATVKMEHHGEFGRHRYVIIRAENERQKFPWADGSTLVIRDQGYEEEKISPRRERFRG